MKLTTINVIGMVLMGAVAAFQLIVGIYFGLSDGWSTAIAPFGTAGLAVLWIILRPTWVKIGYRRGWAEGRQSMMASIPESSDLTDWLRSMLLDDARVLGIDKDDPLMRHVTAEPGSRPQGVRIEHADGKVTPVELADGGMEDGGVHVWLVSTAVHPTKGDRIAVDVLPGRTAIRFPAEG